MSSSPYSNLPATPYQEKDSYNPATGVYIDKRGQGYSVAPEKLEALKKQVNFSGVTGGGKRKSKPDKNKKKSKNNTSKEDTPQEKVVYPSPSANLQVNQEAYLSTQTTQETKGTRAPPLVVQQRFYNQEPMRQGTIESNKPATKEEELNREFSQARQEFQDKINAEQNQFFLNGEEQKNKFTGKGLKTAGTIVALGGASLGVGATKGVVGAVKDVATLQIVPNTINFLTEVTTNPKGVYAQVKNDFTKNPVSFTAEQTAYAITLGKGYKVAKTRGVTEIVKPINVEGAQTEFGTLAEEGQRLWYEGVKIKDIAGTLIVQAKERYAEKGFEGLGLNKKGTLNNINKRVKSKAELRFQSRTGHTKAEVQRQPKPSQQNTMTKTFTRKELLQNQQLQSKVAKFEYPNNLGEYKDFTIVKENQKTQNNVPLPRNEILYARQKRSGYNFGADVKIVSEPKTSSQSTTIRSNEIDLQNGLSIYQKGKVKVTYQYPAKKPNLNPPIPEPKKINPTDSGKVIELVTNINEKGQEVFAPVSEPINTARGFRNPKIREQLFERIKSKREKQLKVIAEEKELQRQKDSLPQLTQARNIYQNQKQSSATQIYSESAVIGQNPFASAFNKKKLQPNYIPPEVSYQPRVSPEQLMNTRSTSLYIGNQEKLLLSQNNKNLQINAQLQGSNLVYSSALTQAHIQSPTQIQFQNTGLTQIQAQEQAQGQTQTQILDLGQNQIQTPQNKIIVIEGIITPTTGRGGGKPEPPAPQPQPQPDVKPPRVEPPFKPIIYTPSRPVPKVPAPFVPIPKVKVESVSRRVQGFDVLVKSQGKFKRVNVGALSKEEALNFGRVRVGRTASATFKITPSKLSSQQIFKEKGQNKDFYQKGDLFIEKKERRIKSLGELQEITFKGIRASKSKNIFRRKTK